MGDRTNTWAPHHIDSEADDNFENCVVLCIKGKNCHTTKGHPHGTQGRGDPSGFEQRFHYKTDEEAERAWRQHKSVRRVAARFLRGLGESEYDE